MSGIYLQATTANDIMALEINNFKPAINTKNLVQFYSQHLELDTSAWINLHLKQNFSCPRLKAIYW
jgi:hypothetical protein